MPSVPFPTSVVEPNSQWRYLAVSRAAFSQTTGLAALPTDEANNEIRAIINSGLNNAGAIQSAGVLGFDLTDDLGQPVRGGKPFFLQWVVEPVTAPANASFIYAVAGFSDKASIAALTADPQFFLGGVNYQPAANPRGLYLPRFDGGSLTPLAIGGGYAIGTSGGRAWYSLSMIRADANTPGGSSMVLSAAGAALGNAAYNIGGIAWDTPNVTNKFLIAFGTYGGAEPGGAVGARTIGVKVRYMIHQDAVDA